MNQRKLSRYLLWMAVIVTLISAYEFCTRVDAMWKPLKMFWNMAVGEKIPLARAATYVDMSIFEIPLYLLCSAALGVWALWARRTRRGCALLIAPSAVLAALGFILPLTLAGKWVRAVRLLPMIDRAVETAISAGEHKEALAQITLQDHALLLEFIQKRDGEGAEHAMAIHMRHAMDGMGLE